jgi:hypothetical protein
MFESLLKSLQTLLSLEVTYGTCLGLVKTSIALFFVRIFGAKRSFNISVVVVLFFVWVWVISIVLEAFLLCRPFAYNWDKSVGGSCGNRNAAFIVAGVMNVVTDFMVMALPLPHVWTLKMNWQKKMGLTSVFCVGAVYVNLCTPSQYYREHTNPIFQHLRYQYPETDISRET